MADPIKKLKIQIKDLNANELYPKTHAKLVECLAEAVQSYAAPLLEANSAMQFKGTLTSANASDILASTSAKVGWTYMVSEAGTYGSHVCEAGDMFICNSAGAAAVEGVGTEGEEGYVAAVPAQAPGWSVIQTNITGAVTAEANLEEGSFTVGDGSHGIQTITLGSAAEALKAPVWNLVSGEDVLGKITLGDSLKVEEYEVTPASGTEGEEGYVPAVTGTRLVISSAITDEIAALGTSVDELSASVAALGTSVDELNASVAALGTEFKNLEERLDETVEAGGEANQKAYSYVKVGTEIIGAQSKTDKLTIVSGTGINVSVAEIIDVEGHGSEGDADYVATEKHGELYLSVSSKITDDIAKLFEFHGTWDLGTNLAHSYSLSVSPSVQCVGYNSTVSASGTWNSKVTAAEGETATVTVTKTPNVSVLMSTQVETKSVTAAFTAPAGSYVRSLKLDGETLKTETVEVSALNASSTKSVSFVYPIYVCTSYSETDGTIASDSLSIATMALTTASTWNVTDLNITPNDGKLYLLIPKKSASITLGTAQYYTLGQYMNISTDPNIISAPSDISSLVIKGGAEEVTVENTYQMITISDASTGNYKFSVTL